MRGKACQVAARDGTRGRERGAWALGHARGCPGADPCSSLAISGYVNWMDLNALCLELHFAGRAQVTECPDGRMCVLRSDSTPHLLFASKFEVPRDSTHAQRL